MNHSHRSHQVELCRLEMALTLAAATPVAFSQTKSVSTPSTEEPQRLERFEVTGSRIKRLDIETPSPVVVYTAEMILQRGYDNFGEFVQTLPFNTSSANSIFQSASFTRAAVTANPRGLGSNRFLTLVDGRRAVSYALTQGNNNSIFDFSSIPAEAIESVEFLKDGASAIYGSDAITGVMNIKLKKNYSGADVSAYAANVTGHDNLRLRGSVLAGWQKDKTSVELILRAALMHSSYYRDYSRSKSVDYTYQGAKGFNLTAVSNWPANVDFNAAQAAAAGLTNGAGWYVIRGGTPQASPAVSQFAYVGTTSANLTDANRYDFSRTLQVFPEQKSYEGYLRFEHKLTNVIKSYATLGFAHTMTYFDFTPFPVTNSISFSGTGPAGLLNIPPTNPYNPFGINITSFHYQGDFGPPRKFFTEGNAASGLLGFNGAIGHDWSWDAGFVHGFNRVNSRNLNAVTATALQAALNGTTRQTALNPFGPSDNSDVVKSIYTTSTGHNKDQAWSSDLSVQGSLLGMPALLGRPSAGDLGLAAGGEWRRERLGTRPDTRSYIGAGGGLPLTGTRRVLSAYLEVSLPVLKELEFQFAGRHESYTDFGKTEKPKVAAKLRLPANPNLDVILRGSYSKSFKAPDLGRLYASQTISFNNSPVNDPLRPGQPAIGLRTITGGNPNLKPENGEVIYFGAVIESPRLKNLSLSVDVLQIRIKNAINTPSSTFLLSAAGQAQYPFAVVRDNSNGFPGPILYVSAVPINAAEQDYKGIDGELRYSVPTKELGAFGLTLEATYTTSIATRTGFAPGKFQSVGQYNNPRMRALGILSWTSKQWAASVSADYIGQYFNANFATPGWGENQVAVVNPSLTYRGGPWQTTLRAGVNNVFGREPPINGYTSSNWDQNTYGENVAAGRLYYLEVKKHF